MSKEFRYLIEFIRPFTNIDNYMDSIFEDIYPGVKYNECINAFDKDLRRCARYYARDIDKYEEEIRIILIVKDRFASLVKYIKVVESIYYREDMKDDIHNIILNTAFANDILKPIRMYDKIKNTNILNRVRAHISSRCLEDICKSITDNNLRKIKNIKDNGG